MYWKRLDNTMTDSGSFTSLLALVDSHLSKTNVQVSRSEDGNATSNRIPIPSLSGAKNGTLSDTTLSLSPGQRLPIPSFNLSESPIQSVLAEQVANMLKAKELKRQQEEEKQRLVDEMKKIKIEEDSVVIDLMQALQDEPSPRLAPKPPATPSTSSSMESLYEQFIDCEEMDNALQLSEPLLPCKTDMSYILDQKIQKGKCSAFGKVLTSRLRPTAAPYFRENIKSDIRRFDFKTQSPCDLINEKLRKPKRSVDTSYVPDILKFI